MANLNVDDSNSVDSFCKSSGWGISLGASVTKGISTPDASLGTTGSGSLGFGSSSQVRQTAHVFCSGAVPVHAVALPH